MTARLADQESEADRGRLAVRPLQGELAVEVVLAAVPHMLERHLLGGIRERSVRNEIYVSLSCL